VRYWGGGGGVNGRKWESRGISKTVKTIKTR
jgi:hypothetical protein